MKPIMAMIWIGKLLKSMVMYSHGRRLTHSKRFLVSISLQDCEVVTNNNNKYHAIKRS